MKLLQLWLLPLLLVPLAGGVEADPAQSEETAKSWDVNELGDSRAVPIIRHLLARGPRLHANRIEVTDLEFEHVTGEARIADGWLHLEQLRGRMYGGRAEGHVSISLGDGSIHIQLQVHGMLLDEFLLRYAGVEDPPAGIIHGEVRLVMPEAVGNLMHGQADLRMEQGDVVTMGALTTLILGSATARRGQDSARARIRIADRHATFEEFIITSPSVRLIGSGHIAFDGSTDIIFSPRSTPGYLNLIPVAGTILSWTIGRFTRSVGRFRVTGHISNPQFIARPF
ncbi:MAG: hypothetical protein EA402_11635 [Planctomycetota bacterium]|nr:MAG: hypothetical protein EA402_11635 [Planctomycetota bacterium]